MVHCKDQQTVRTCNHNEAKCITRRLSGPKEPVADSFVVKHKQQEGQRAKRNQRRNSNLAKAHHVLCFFGAAWLHLLSDYWGTR